MSEHKHTPGPWAVHRLSARGNGLWVVAGNEEWVIADITPMADVEGEDMANATLIARAPDLLAENERLREALRPFAHRDFSKRAPSMIEGDNSPVWGRNNAVLTLGDFRRARAALEPKP